MNNSAFDSGTIWDGLVVAVIVLPLFFSRGVIVWIVMAAMLAAVVYKGGKIGTQVRFKGR